MSAMPLAESGHQRTPRGKIEKGLRCENRSPCDSPRSNVESVAIVAPVPQIVHPNFEHLHIAVAGGEGIAGKERGRGRNGETPVAQPEIVVLELQRPMRRERPFGAS